MNYRGSVNVPADVDIEDKILFGLTARQTLILVPVALALLGTWPPSPETFPSPFCCSGPLQWPPPQLLSRSDVSMG
ncbi:MULTISPECIES: PrgI family protein [unclassified Glycomyces]|uniref:PrgI family protein n=1 Tax=Glycomyces sp. NRRL B-16210 TaxID=1463821 RepID=UPI0009DDCA03